MNISNKAIVFFTGLMLLSNVTLAQPNSLTDINYKFDQTKLDESEDTFQFMRSFAGYYYGIIAKNTNSLNIANIAGKFGGWCVGDAHPENFGILIQKDGPNIFTMNDMDDSGPCPIAYDLLRMLVSSRLYMSDIDAQEIIKSYTDGLNGKNASIPNTIKSMDKDATKAGKEISSKKLNGNTFKRKSSMEEVGSSIKAEISSVLQAQYKNEKLRVLDIVATSKVGGGSGGLQRYQILITNADKHFIHLELKELVTPSIAPVATASIPDQATRIKKTIQINLGLSASLYYNVLSIQGKSMLLRPKFSGNKGVTLADSSEKENIEIINFEAFIMGRIHANSINVEDYTKALGNMDSYKWEDDIEAFTILLNKKFNELK